MKRIVMFAIIFYVIFQIPVPSFSQTHRQKENEKFIRVAGFLTEYYTKDLKIKNVAVQIDKESVAIGGTPNFAHRSLADGQIILAIAGAGAAAPWTKDITFMFQIDGLPVGYIGVPTRMAALASQGKISERDFIKSFRAEKLPFSLDFPRDLLVPVIESHETWNNSVINICDAAETGEKLNVQTGDFIPEFLQSAYIESPPSDDGSRSVAGVIDFLNENDAKRFVELNSDQSLNTTVYRTGSIVYLFKGSGEVIQSSLGSIRERPYKSISEKKVTPYEGVAKGKGMDKKIPVNRYLILGAGLLLIIILSVLIFISSGRKRRRKR